VALITSRFLAISALTLGATAIFAQSEEWYGNHDLGNRYEGLFGENQGSPEWELRSFVASVEPYPMDRSADLTIRYYVPDSTKAFIKASVISRTPSYLMEPKEKKLSTDKGWRSFAGWSTKDVLLQKKIRSSDLGVLVRLGADSEAVHLFAPAIVYSSSPPKTLKTYRFDLFTAVALKDFTFDVIGNNYRRSYKHAAAGDRTNVAIEFNATEIPEGPTRVVLRPEIESSGEKLPLDWRFYHKGLP